MVEEGYDLVIRVNPDPDETLIGRIFLHDRLVVVAHPELPRPAKGKAAPAVVYGPGGGLMEWAVIRRGRKAMLTVDPVLRLTSLLMVRDAVRAGAGAARLPISLVSQDLQQGRLALWGTLDEPEVALWALYPSRRLLSARVSAFLDYLKQAFPNGTPEELAAYLARE